MAKGMPKSCPNCKGNDAKVVETGWGLLVRAGAMTTVPADFYICMDCGFGQYWVEDANLEKLRKYRNKK